MHFCDFHIIFSLRRGEQKRQNLPVARLYCIKQGDAQEQGPFTFSQLQHMWRAGTVKITDKIRRADKSEWHSVEKVRCDLESGGGQLTVGRKRCSVSLFLDDNTGLETHIAIAFQSSVDIQAILLACVACNDQHTLTDQVSRRRGGVRRLLASY